MTILTRGIRTTHLWGPVAMFGIQGGGMWHGGLHTNTPVVKDRASQRPLHWHPPSGQTVPGSPSPHQHDPSDRPALFCGQHWADLQVGLEYPLVLADLALLLCPVNQEEKKGWRMTVAHSFQCWLPAALSICTQQPMPGHPASPCSSVHFLPHRSHLPVLKPIMFLPVLWWCWLPRFPSTLIIHQTPFHCQKWCAPDGELLGLLRYEWLYPSSQKHPKVAINYNYGTLPVVLLRIKEITFFTELLQG